ncbi:MAG: type II toxin-antitoxin system prevent-host-death family antitoxin [Actinomycetota bacterium]|nr:type II toxin-antitoxin system prevent-host-death family antitoxin [Actinomycetota bacterium]
MPHQSCQGAQYLDRVKAGETVEVTDRGELVALLTPPGRVVSARDRLVAQGKLIPASRPLVLPDPVPVPPGAPTTAEALDAEREERF